MRDRPWLTARRLTSAVLLIVLLGAGYFVSGCFMCRYQSADRESGVSKLIGHECVVSEPADFPAGKPHFFPTVNPPGPLPLVRLEHGVVLRVSHADRWVGPIDPSGNIVYAKVENGPHAGRSVVVGSLGTPYQLTPPRTVVICENSQVGLTAAAGRSLHPHQTKDDGFFYPYPWPEDLNVSRLLILQPAATQGK
jgi:hypothetical protein